MKGFLKLFKTNILNPMESIRELQDIIEQLKPIINKDIYDKLDNIKNEMEVKFEELEAKIDDLESDNSEKEERIDEIQSEKEEQERRITYYIEDVIMEHHPNYELVDSSKLYELQEKEKHIKSIHDLLYNYEMIDEDASIVKIYDKLWEILPHYTEIIKSQDWDELENIEVINKPIDLLDNKYFIHYVREYNEDYGVDDIVQVDVYKDTECLVNPGEGDSAPWDIFESGEPGFKKVGVLKTLYNPLNQKKIKRIIYVDTQKKNLLNKYFNLLIKNINQPSK